jgi:hypothetical protein
MKRFLFLLCFLLVEFCGWGQGLYVDSNIPISGNGLTWSTAFKTFDEAIKLSWTDNTIKNIYLAEGIYKPLKKKYNLDGTNIITSSDRDMTFHIKEGISIIGGFPSGGGVRNYKTYKTILNGDTNNDIGKGKYNVIFSSNSGANGIVLDGLIITGGNDTGGLVQNGAGVYINGGNNTIKNCYLYLNEFRLQAGSPAINAGDANGSPTDILGNVRINGIDIGAYESESAIIAPATSNLINNIGQLESFFLTNNNFLIASLKPIGINPVSGNVSASVWIDATQGTNVKRHYEITPTTNSATATGKITLYFTQADFTDYNSQNPAPANLLPASPTDATGIANLKIEKRSGTSSDGSGVASTYTLPGTLANIDPADEDIKWDANNNRWEVSFDVVGFSGFWVTGSPANALTVNLISFNATRFEDNANLTWRTTNEENFSHFEVTKSNNAKEFANIGRVDGSSKNGIYNFTDANAALSTGEAIYYRLKMVDQDGTTKLSKIVSVIFDKKEKNLSVENPANNGEFTATTNVENPNFAIVNALGKKIDISINKLSPNKFILKVKEAIKGVYFLNLEIEGGKMISRKVLVQ